MSTVLHPEVDGLGAAQCGEVIKRVCNSQEVRRAARLRDFLHYVAQRTSDSPGSPISEQEIGVKVFGRPPDYDTSIDNIVRVNASELRKRITAYFAAEGAHEPIWFEIPRGSYAPRFMLRPAAGASPLAAQMSIEVQTATLAGGSGRHRSVALLGTLLLLVVALNTGVNGKRQVNLYDPDGTRVEIMEPNTVTGKPVPSSRAPAPTASAGLPFKAPANSSAPSGPQ